MHRTCHWQTEDYINAVHIHGNDELEDFEKLFVIVPSGFSHFSSNHAKLAMHVKHKNCV